MIMTTTATTKDPHRLLRLFDILKTPRPTNGAPVSKEWISATLDIPAESIVYQPWGCHISIVDPSTHTVPAVAYVAHLDTIDTGATSLKTVKLLFAPPSPSEDSGRWLLHLASSSSSSCCLGADDGAGLFILSRMIEAKVPGHYLMFQQEECGGVGVREFCTSPYGIELQRTLKITLEFDRKGTKDVVYSHMSSGDCANPQFAQYVADLINSGDSTLQLLPSDSGLFTDVAELSKHNKKLQCVNISVGYEFAHTLEETLDLTYLMKLVSVMMNTGITDDLLRYKGPKKKQRPTSWRRSSPPLWGRINGRYRHSSNLGWFKDYCYNYPDMVAGLLTNLYNNDITAFEADLFSPKAQDTLEEEGDTYDNHYRHSHRY